MVSFAKDAKILGYFEFVHLSYHKFFLISLEVRHFTTISKAKFEEGGVEKMMVPAATEAMLVALWDNMHDRVKWQHEQKGDDEEAVLDLKANEQQGKCTDSKAGQNPFKGWTDDGTKFFKNCVDLAKAGRKSPGCEAFEEEVLAEVRKKHKITALTPEELAGNKKRKLSKAPINEADVLDLFCEDDE